MARRAEVLGGGEGLREEVADDGVLEAGDEVEGLLVAGCGGDGRRWVAGLRLSGPGCRACGELRWRAACRGSRRSGGRRS